MSVRAGFVVAIDSVNRCYDGSFPSRSDPMAALTCGHANDSGLAMSKWPAPGIRIRRTWSPACVAASTYASTSGKGTKSSCDPSTSTCGIAKGNSLIADACA